MALASATLNSIGLSSGSSRIGRYCHAGFEERKRGSMRRGGPWLVILAMMAFLRKKRLAMHLFHKSDARERPSAHIIAFLAHAGIAILAASPL
jgi:hypothetical protein